MDNNPMPTQEGEQMAELKKEVAELGKQTSPAAAVETPQINPTPAPPNVSPEPQVVQPQTSTPLTPPDTSGKKNPVLWIAIVIFVLALLAGGAYVALNMGLLGKKACTQDAKVCADGTSVGRVGPNCEFAPCPTPTATPDPTADWQTYSNNEIGFSIKHPSDLEPKVDTAAKTVTFSKVGPTQKEGTEFFDGISVSIKGGSLGGKSLKEFVDAVAQENESSEVSEVVSGPEMVNIAGLSAYKLTVKGLGEFDYYYFQKGTDGYIEIVDASVDPSGQGYLETVNLMLESLKVIVASPSPSPSPSPASPSPTP